MKLVKENIKFKRGIDPRKGLDLGEYRTLYPPFNIDSIEGGLYMVEIIHSNQSKYFLVDLDKSHKYVWDRSDYYHRKIDDVDNLVSGDDMSSSFRFADPNEWVNILSLKKLEDSNWNE